MCVCVFIGLNNLYQSDSYLCRLNETENTGARYESICTSQFAILIVLLMKSIPV